MDTLDSKLATDMRRLGYSNEEILEQLADPYLTEWNLLSKTALAKYARAKVGEEMEIISEEIRQWWHQTKGKLSR